MEFNMLEVLLRHREHIATVGEEHIAALLVLGHILILAFLEVLQFSVIVALYPTGLIQMYGFPTALRVVLVLQTVLDHLKLQLPHGTDNLTVIELVDEQLGHTLVHQLVDTLLKLLRLHGVVVLDILEQFWRERGQSAEVELFTLRQCVANFEDTTRIWQSYNIPRPCLVDGALTLRHELRGRGEAHRLTLAHMEIGLVTLELTTAHLTEGDTRTMVGVDIGRDLEDETCKLGFLRLHVALLGLRGTGTGSDLHKTVQQFLHAKVIQGRTDSG